MTISINQAEEAIGIPANEWAGRCHEIASALVDAGVVVGKVRYGHYLGEIAPASMFHGRPIIQHGWIELTDGSVVDPTRWVFEGVEPYIFHTSDSTEEYDVGGNMFRLQQLRPCPEYDASAKQIFELPIGPVGLVIRVLLPEKGPYNKATVDQVFWLANLPVSMLGEAAEDVYRWIDIACELKAFIPMDNWDLVVGE